MVKLIIDFIQLLNTAAPLFTSLAIFILLAILLSKSIKKHAVTYYIVLAIPCLLVIIPSVLRMFGAETYNFIRIPFLGALLRDYIHMGTLGFPLLIIIMYIGALNPKNSNVKKLLSIRKELSIISGFPVLTHSFIRVVNNLPNALKFFTDNEGYLVNTPVTNELGAGITNFSFVLGILMVLLFIPLWVTSFDSIRKRMGNLKWRKFQKLAYVLYATLFIHAMGLQVGYMLNPRVVQEVPKPMVEAAVVKSDMRSDKNVAQVSNKNQTGTTKSTAGARVQSKGFSDINVTQQAKQYIHIASLILIFGSYLFLRIKKAQKDTSRKLRL